MLPWAARSTSPGSSTSTDKYVPTAAPAADELNQLRERVRKAQLTAQDTDDKRDENLTVAIETYLATYEGHTPEQPKAKAMERLDHVSKAGVKDRRTAFHVVRNPPPDKQ
jgi:hypothetical protein